MHAITTLLNSHDALNLALTSRNFHDLAIDQVSTYLRERHWNKTFISVEVPR